MKKRTFGIDSDGRALRLDVRLPWGVDVSHYNGVIDWKKVRAAGASFAYIKATEGATYVDPTYRRNLKGARGAGLKAGAFHFFRTGTALDAQLDNFARTVSIVEPGDLQPVIDVEIPSQWRRLSVAARNDLIVAWIEGVRNRLGRNVQPLIYLSPSFADNVLHNDARLAENPLWLAHYTSASRTDVPAPWKRWTFWQWTERGHVAGIETYVDLDRFNGTLDQLNKLLVTENID